MLKSCQNHVAITKKKHNWKQSKHLQYLLAAFFDQSRCEQCCDLDKSVHMTRLPVLPKLLYLSMQTNKKDLLQWSRQIAQFVKKPQVSSTAVHRLHHQATSRWSIYSVSKLSTCHPRAAATQRNAPPPQLFKTVLLTEYVINERRNFNC